MEIGATSEMIAIVIMSWLRAIKSSMPITKPRFPEKKPPHLTKASKKKKKEAHDDHLLTYL